VVNGDLVLLQRKYRAIPHLELWERLFDTCLVDCSDERVRDLGGISYEDWLTTNDSSPSSLASEELTTATNTKSSRSDSEEIRHSPEISNSRSVYEISDSGSLLENCERYLTAFYCFIWARRRAWYQAWFDKLSLSTR